MLSWTSVSRSSSSLLSCPATSGVSRIASRGSFTRASVSLTTRRSFEPSFWITNLRAAALVAVGGGGVAVGGTGTAVAVAGAPVGDGTAVGALGTGVAVAAGTGVLVGGGVGVGGGSPAQ